MAVVPCIYALWFTVKICDHVQVIYSKSRANFPISDASIRSDCRLDPLDLGIKRCTVEDLAGGNAELNASILMDVFGGKRGAVADALNLNAGVALAACEIAASPQEGVAMAQVFPYPLLFAL